MVEDYCRLAIEDESFRQVKDLRHRLRDLVDGDLARRLLAGRRSEHDPGADSFTSSEARREDWYGLLAANLKRAQEAARVLEESSKLLALEVFSRQIKALRFELYELEKRLLNGRRAQVAEWFKRPLGDGPRLYLVVDEAFYRGCDLIADLETVLRQGVDLLQWRQKSGSDRHSLARARQLAGLCRKYQTPFVVNDRPDIAMLVQADALHLGQDDLPLAEARRLVGDRIPVGRSTHSLDQALAAAKEGADYLGFGPIFTTPSKVNPDPVVGIEGLREVLSLIRQPVVAIGGLDESNLAAVSATGVAAVAVIRAILQSEEPAAATAELQRLLSKKELPRG